MTSRQLRGLLEAATAGDLETVKDYLSKGADINYCHLYNCTPLNAAAKGGFTNIVKLLLGRADIDPNKEKSNGDSPLQSAASEGHLDIIQLLLKRTDIDPNKENKYGNTPLHAAAEGGFINIVKLLLERADIDPNKENKEDIFYKSFLHPSFYNKN
ncbi:unnamed protein product [Mytilus edulis]|uniref:Ankyrin repeat protein n=1 Tax=Mytilus edulis TaxID=6550 RepID=A0A8S3V6Q2_MYTED|nr:unnamed protein product [Mytilus edulis]